MSGQFEPEGSIMRYILKKHLSLKKESFAKLCQNIKSLKGEKISTKFHILSVFSIGRQWSNVDMIGKGKHISQGLYVQPNGASSENSTNKLF